MAVLSGGGNWLSLQGKKDAPAEVGSVTRGVFVGFEANVPSGNPALPPQGVLTLEIAGEHKKVGCPKALARVFENNPVRTGTPLAITYEGQKKSKAGFTFHSFKVETEDALAFPPAANEPMSNEESELNRRLAEARAKRAA